MFRVLGRGFVVLFVLCHLLLSPASAQNFGSKILFQDNPRSGVWLANNAHHRIDFGDVTGETDNAITWAMDNALGPTAIDPVRVDSPDNDVKILDDYYQEFWVAGWVSCPDDAEVTGTHPNQVCKGQKLHFNLRITADYSTDQRRGLGCHELGHTVGLRHVEDNPDADTCMRTQNLSTRPQTYSAHDHAQLRDEYG